MTGPKIVACGLLSILPIGCRQQVNRNGSETAITRAVMVKVPFPKIEDHRTLIMSLSRSSCFGYCADYRIQIYGDGRVEYQGICSVAVVGGRTSRISQEAVNALFNQFKEADFFSLAERYVFPVSDYPHYTLSISFDGREKTVIDYLGPKAGMPEAVTHLERAIDSTTSSSRWIIGGSGTFLKAAKEHPCK